MIATIQGTLTDAGPLFAIIEAGGLGYELSIPVTTAEKLPPVGQSTMLYVHDVYREDAALLYGFADRASRDFFKLVIEKVSGIGPRTAISLMSRFPLTYLLEAIAGSDSVALAKCPGIGPKTAERIIIELKDKIREWSLHSGISGASDKSVTPINNSGNFSENEKDALDALLALGYKASEAEKALSKARKQLGENADTQSLIRRALGN